MVLGYLISPVVQIVDNNGKPIVGAKIYVYKAGTTNTVNTYRDFSNHYNTTPVLTDTLGNCTIIASDDMIYDIVVKDNSNNLLMSKDNLTVSSGINPDINLRFNEGYGIIIRKNGNTVTIAVDTDLIATKDDLAAKQDKLTAGDNIDITNDNIINVVNRKTLYTQWPLKVDRGSSMVKLYLDQDFVGNNTEILPGADLTASYDEFGHKIIGVDTDSTIDENVEYGFVANKSNTLHGNYGAVFGQNNSVSGSRNAAFGGSNEVDGYSNFVCGYDNDAHGSMNFVANNLNAVSGSANTVLGASNTTDGNYNFIAGQNNTISANSCGIISQNMNVTTDNSYVFGKAASAIPSGTVLGSNSTNMLELRNDKRIFYNYNDQMLQLAPYTAGTGITVNNHQIRLNNKVNYRVEISKEYTITSNNEYVVLPLNDEFAPVKAWLNANYTKMTCPLFYIIKIKFDSQVQNPGMVLLQFDYTVSWGNDPVITRDTPYTYITKFWSEFSDAHAAGCIDAKNMSDTAGVALDLRNIENNTKWTAGQKLKVDIGFYTRYIY